MAAHLEITDTRHRGPLHSSNNDFREIQDFKILEKLGQGSFGTAFKVRDNKTSEICVMKQTPINSGDPGDLTNKLKECQVMKRLRHNNICRFKMNFNSPTDLCMIFEYCDRGDLENYLKNQKGFMLSDQRIKKFIVEILLALEYLHSQSIIHRDVKPSNIFLKGKDYTIQLGDFGIAAQNDTGLRVVENVGTLAYQAPEVLEGTDYDTRADIWSLGCVVYNMFSYDIPFSALSEERLVEKIRFFPHRQLDTKVPQELRDLYEICMNKDYKKRPTAADLLGLDLIQKWAKETNCMNHQLLKCKGGAGPLGNKNKGQEAIDHYIAATKSALAEIQSKQSAGKSTNQATSPNESKLTNSRDPRRTNQSVIHQSKLANSKMQSPATTTMQGPAFSQFKKINQGNLLGFDPTRKANSNVKVKKIVQNGVPNKRKTDRPDRTEATEYEPYPQSQMEMEIKGKIDQKNTQRISNTRGQPRVKSNYQNNRITLKKNDIQFFTNGSSSQQPQQSLQTSNGMSDFASKNTLNILDGQLKNFEIAPTKKKEDSLSPNKKRKQSLLRGMKSSGDLTQAGTVIPQTFDGKPLKGGELNSLIQQRLDITNQRQNLISNPELRQYVSPPPNDFSTQPGSSAAFNSKQFMSKRYGGGGQTSTSKQDTAVLQKISPQTTTLSKGGLKPLTGHGTIQVGVLSSSELPPAHQPDVKSGLINQSKYRHQQQKKVVHQNGSPVAPIGSAAPAIGGVPGIPAHPQQILKHNHHNNREGGLTQHELVKQLTKQYTKAGASFHQQVTPTPALSNKNPRNSNQATLEQRIQKTTISKPIAQPTPNQTFLPSKPSQLPAMGQTNYVPRNSQVSQTPGFNVNNGKMNMIQQQQQARAFASPGLPSSKMNKTIITPNQMNATLQEENHHGYQNYKQFQVQKGNPQGMTPGKIQKIDQLQENYRNIKSFKI